MVPSISSPREPAIGTSSAPSTTNSKEQVKATMITRPFAHSMVAALVVMPLEHIEGCGLGAARGLAYIAHVVDMKVDEFAEGLRARYT